LSTGGVSKDSLESAGVFPGKSENDSVISLGVNIADVFLGKSENDSVISLGVNIPHAVYASGVSSFMATGKEMAVDALTIPRRYERETGPIYLCCVNPSLIRASHARVSQVIAGSLPFGPALALGLYPRGLEQLGFISTTQPIHLQQVVDPVLQCSVPMS
jgi:hypothetical protein